MRNPNSNLNLKWPKEAGRKPSQRLMKKASGLARPLSDDHVVVAMVLRPQGVTQGEVMALFKHPHRNKLRRLVEDKEVKEEVLPTKSRMKRVRLRIV